MHILSLYIITNMPCLDDIQVYGWWFKAKAQEQIQRSFPLKNLPFSHSEKDREIYIIFSGLVCTCTRFL